MVPCVTVPPSLQLTKTSVKLLFASSNAKVSVPLTAQFRGGSTCSTPVTDGWWSLILSAWRRTSAASLSGTAGVPLLAAWTPTGDVAVLTVSALLTASLDACKLFAAMPLFVSEGGWPLPAAAIGTGCVDGGMIAELLAVG